LEEIDMSLDQILERYGRVDGTMPETCPQGRSINVMADTTTSGIPKENLWGVLEQLTGEWECLRRATCWTCSKGIELAEEDLVALKLPADSGVIEALVEPWTSEAPRGEMRQFSYLCDRGKVLCLMTADLALMVGHDCLELQSCAQCPKAVSTMSEQLGELFELGWDSTVGRDLRRRSGLLC
jgi:hypothetical protein